MKEQTRPTEQALAGKYQDLNHYILLRKKRFVNIKLSAVST